MKFLRQLYKTELKTETILDASRPESATAERRFRGVEGVKSMKGELFGHVNLLKYKDGISEIIRVAWDRIASSTVVECSERKIYERLWRTCRRPN